MSRTAGVRGNGRGGGGGRGGATGAGAVAGTGGSHASEGRMSSSHDGSTVATVSSKPGGGRQQGQGQGQGQEQRQGQVVGGKKTYRTKTFDRHNQKDKSTRKFGAGL